MPRDPFTSTRSPGWTIATAASAASSLVAKVTNARCRHPGGRPPPRPAPPPARRRPRAADRRRRGPRRGRRPRAGAVACSPSSSISPMTAMRRVACALASTSSALLRRGRVGVVAVVDDRDAARQPHDLAAMRRRPQAGALSRDVGERHVELQRHRGRRRGCSRGFRGRPAASSTSTLPRGVVITGAGAVDPAIDDVGCAHVGGALDAERHDPAAKSHDPRHDSRDRPRWRPAASTGSRPRGSPPSRRQSHRARRRSPDALRRRSSTPARRARRCAPAC